MVSTDDQSFRQLVHLGETINRQVINMLPNFYGWLESLNLVLMNKFQAVTFPVYSGSKMEK